MATKSATYPKAIFADNGISGGSYTSGPPKLVIHTTETSGMPGYDNGWSAPHLTYDPRSRIFVQHRTFKTASRALRNEPGGVQTNRDMALQLEIICYSAKWIADQQWYRDWVGHLDQIPGALDDIAEFVDWVCDDWDIQKVWPGKQSFSSSQANAAGFRMSPAEWDGFNGVCGHQHVPENTHWDPGAIDWKKLLPEDVMTPEQEAKLDAVLAGLANIPSQVWAREWNEPGIGTDDKITTLQSLVRGYKNTVATRAVVADLHAMETAELEAVADAVADELAARLA